MYIAPTEQVVRFTIQYSEPEINERNISDENETTFGEFSVRPKGNKTLKCQEVTEKIDLDRNRNGEGSVRRSRYREKISEKTKLWTHIF